ncbi:hypothetical protein SUGI_0561000 [Cryptomeria japonica]|nr:hypothetical protein SUGI_0561000 [Cryptomeria japonica]
MSPLPSASKPRFSTILQKNAHYSSLWHRPCPAAYPRLATEMGFIGRFQGKRTLCEYLWSWEEKHTMPLKPWYLNFNPTTESFDKTPTWKALPADVALKSTREFWCR